MVAGILKGLAKVVIDTPPPITCDASCLPDAGSFLVAKELIQLVALIYFVSKSV